MIKKLSSGLDRLKKYGGAIKERFRPYRYQEKPIEVVDTPVYRPPRTLDEAAEFLKREFGLEKEKTSYNSIAGLTSPCLSCARDFYGVQKTKRISKQRKIVENIDLDIDREGIPIKDLGRLSRGQDDPISAWRSIKDIEEN